MKIRISLDEKDLLSLMCGDVVTIREGVGNEIPVEIILQDIGSDLIVELADSARIELMERRRQKFAEKEGGS